MDEKMDGKLAWVDPDVGTGGPGPPPLNNHKNIGFLSNYTGRDPLKITKLPKQHSMMARFSW